MKKIQLLFVLPLLMSLVSCNTTDSTIKISFKEYVEIVNNQQEGDKDIFILTSSSCAHCQKIKPLINKFIDENTDEKLHVYELSADYSITVKGDYVYKDATMGYLNGMITMDCLKALDNRINLYAIESQPSSEELFAGPDSNYTYVYTPLFMWYENKMEKRVVNNVEKLIDKNEDGTLNYESFVKMMEFPEETPTWDNPFNLTYYSAK